MKFILCPFSQLIAFLAASVLLAFPFPDAQAATFSEQDIDQSNFISRTAPIESSGIHQLIILEQISTDK